MSSVVGDRPQTVASPKLSRGHSCVVCYQRKVKCDGKRPCSTCVRYSRAADCRSARSLASIREVAANERALLLRLKRYEHLLIVNGIPLNGPAGEDGEARMIETTGSEDDDGHVIIQGGHPRFVDNVIWNSLGSEFGGELSEKNEQSEIDTSDDDVALTPDSFILDKPSTRSLRDLTPSAPQVLRLWQTFLENFNPLIKLLHSPTVQHIVSSAIADPERLNTSTEALLFSVYLCAVTTMTEQCCLEQLGERKSRLVASYADATRQALVNAQFLKSTNIAILQSLTLYQLACQKSINEQAMWMLTGLSSRLAQMMGLHREHSLGQLSPFDSEIRRRLWWQIVILDNRSAQLSGATTDGASSEWGDTRRPLNINDSDLSPFMNDLPFEYQGPTEMLFCTIKFEVGECMRHLKAVEKLNKANAQSLIMRKCQIINTFEIKIENLLDRCDASIPLHLMSMFLGRSAVCQMRFSVLQTKQNGSNFSDMLQDDRDNLFQLALQILEYDSRTYSTSSLHPFLWHVGSHFPFPAFIHVLTDLLYRTEGDQAIQGWTSVGQAYGNHPELISDAHKNPLCFALGNLTLKAWERRIPDSMIIPAVASLQKQRPTKAPRAGMSDIEDSFSPRKTPRPEDTNTQTLVKSGRITESGDLSLPPFLTPADIQLVWGSEQNMQSWTL
ncbi:hypothetical protein QQS21_000011 [Conoideocrella luteorostrata]|uniref:Zn(2)-C6 fungal-type domain-containing protein n=1 Tax=Conoideocrella luteorostrata TaxID=1105319 RepID=A0AAJ0CZP8_9HYPO|nr:hypothetical protein QQS21_000011 [Conoideocrella luteorostrata]